jgi:dolichyl-phosphate-mannose--protein O-mannosyl transferase
MLHSTGYSQEDRGRSLANDVLHKQSSPAKAVPPASGPRPPAKAAEALAVFLISLAFLLCLISNPPYRVFDEQIYVAAANAIRHGQPDPVPDHPPAAKYLISAGIRLAGDNPLGWRLMPAIFGSLLISFVFVWMSRYGRDVAWTAVALIATNGFWFVMSRMAMLSIFEATFAVIGLYLLSERRYWLCGAAIGFAAACRWNASFALLLAVAYALFDDGLAAAIQTSLSSVFAYILAWLPEVGPHAARFVQAQQYILHYHLHPPGNPAINDKWYHWPVRTVAIEGINHLLANPLVTLLGAAGILILLRSRNLVALAGLVFYLQWAVTPRAYMYYYYYLDTILMMSMAAALVICRYKLKIGKQEIRLYVPVTILSAAWFVVHYAAFTALPPPYDTLFPF